MLIQTPLGTWYELSRRGGTSQVMWKATFIFTQDENLELLAHWNDLISLYPRDIYWRTPLSFCLPKIGTVPNVHVYLCPRYENEIQFVIKQNYSSQTHAWQVSSSLSAEQPETEMRGIASHFFMYAFVLQMVGKLSFSIRSFGTLHSTPVKGNLFRQLLQN